MSLAKILEDMNKVRPFADENLDDGPIATMGVRRGRKRNAEEQLKSLKQDYTAELLRSAVFILTVGSDREAFENIATTEGNCMFSKADSFFQDLASRVHPTLYQSRDTVANLFDVVGRHLEDKAREIGVREYPQLLMKSQYRRMINNEQEFVDLLKIAVTEQVGGELVGINAIHGLTDSAIEKGHSASVTPIVLSSEDTKFCVGLVEHLERLTPKVFLVVAGKAPKALKTLQGAIVVKDASSESVAQALQTIKNSLKR